MISSVTTAIVLIFTFNHPCHQQLQQARGNWSHTQISPWSIWPWENEEALRSNYRQTQICSATYLLLSAKDHKTYLNHKNGCK